MLNSTIWLARSDAPWRELLERFGPWESVYSRFRKWRRCRTKIHAAVDAYVYSIYVTLSEGHQNNINFAIPVLEHINIEGSNVLADRGYDSTNLLIIFMDRAVNPQFH